MPVNGFGSVVTGGAPLGAGLANASANVFQDFTSVLKDLAFFNLAQKKQEEAAAKDAALREQLLRMQTEASAAQNTQDITSRQTLAANQLAQEKQLAADRNANALEIARLNASTEKQIAALRAKENQGFRNEADVRSQLLPYVEEDGLKYIPNKLITEAYKKQSLEPLQPYIDKFTKVKDFKAIFDANGEIPRKLARELGFTTEEKKALEKINLIADPIKKASAIDQFEGGRRTAVAGQPSSGGGMSFPDLNGGLPNIPDLLKRGAGSALALSPVGLMGASELTPEMSALGSRARQFLGAGALASPAGMLASQFSSTLGGINPLQMALQSLQPSPLNYYQANLQPQVLNGRAIP